MKSNLKVKITRNVALWSTKAFYSWCSKYYYISYSYPNPNHAGPIG